MYIDELLNTQKKRNVTLILGVVFIIAGIGGIIFGTMLLAEIEAHELEYRFRGLLNEAISYMSISFIVGAIFLVAGALLSGSSLYIISKNKPGIEETKMNDTMFCTNCGNEIEHGSASKFCESCGSKIE